LQGEICHSASVEPNIRRRLPAPKRRRKAGYLAGAVEAAKYAVLRIINELEAAP
jgi:hypothetical protein